MNRLQRRLFALAVACLIIPAFSALAMNRQEADRIIDRAYQDLLGRRPDADGANHYRKQLMENDWSEDRVRRDLRGSQEYKNRGPDVIIRSAYREVLGRDPDPGGLNLYRRRIKEDRWSENRIKESLRDSEEYRKERTDLLIRDAYREVLGRDPDPGGLRTFRQKVDNDRWSKDDVKRALRDSDEYRRKR